MTSQSKIAYHHHRAATPCLYMGYIFLDVGTLEVVNARDLVVLSGSFTLASHAYQHQTVPIIALLWFTAVGLNSAIGLSPPWLHALSSPSLVEMSLSSLILADKSPMYVSLAQSQQPPPPVLGRAIVATAKTTGSPSRWRHVPSAADSCGLAGGRERQPNIEALSGLFLAYAGAASCRYNCCRVVTQCK